MKILVRADASRAIGTGHVMRCLALAEAARERGAKVSFIAAHSPEAIEKRVHASRMGVFRLSCRPGSAADARKTAEHAKRTGAELLVLDGYHFNAGYRNAVKRSVARLLVVDDRLHAGRDAFLRKEFRVRAGRVKRIAVKARKVLVTMGGSDPDNVSLTVLKALGCLAHRKLEIIVVAGPGYSGEKELKSLARRSGLKMRLKKNPRDMARLMESADAAVSAAGSTAWELAFMGVPSLLLVLGSNQRRVASEMARKKAAIILSGNGGAALSKTLERLLDSPVLRKRMSRAGQRLVDGGGAERVLVGVGL